MLTKISIGLNVLLILVIAGYCAYRNSVFALERPWVAYSSVSPDGRWRCMVRDIHPLPEVTTYAYSIEHVGKRPLNGTQYVSHQDSEDVSAPLFEWSDGTLTITDSEKTLVATFVRRYQQWERIWSVKNKGANEDTKATTP